MGLDMIGQNRWIAKLGNAPLVSAGWITGIGEFCVEKSSYAGLRHFDARKPCAKRNAVRIIVFAREGSGQGL